VSDSLVNRAVVSTEISVRFAETDLMGVVHHSAYIVWFEVGRVAWLRASGVPYTEFSAAGRHLAVTDIQASFRASCKFGDIVRIHTCLQRLRSRQMDFTYEIRHAADDTLLVTGTSEHVCVDEAGRTARLPSELLARLQAGFDRIAAQAQGCVVRTPGMDVGTVTER
jgi:acyl-CoA thioester hydrolase